MFHLWMVSLASLIVLAASGSKAQGPPKPEIASSGIAASTTWAPLPPMGGSFALVENLGQWPEPIRFVGRLPGMVVRAEAGRIALELRDRSGQAGGGVVVRLSFEGASEGATVEGLDPLEGRYSFFLGNDPSRWVADAAGHSRVRYSDLYSGIDLVLGAGGGGMKYDLLVGANADLGQVRLRCEGAETVRACADGSFELKTSVGELAHVLGRSWSVLPSGETREVQCAWRQVADDTLAIEAFERDASLPLVIDPGLLWSTYLGSSDNIYTETLDAVGCDAAGDIVVAGTAVGTDFPQTPGTFQDPKAGIENAFVTKFRGSDGALIYSSVFGATTSYNRPRKVAMDERGRATVVGWTSGADFPTTAGAFDTLKTGPDKSGFVTRFSPLGNNLVYSTYIEGPQTGGDVLALHLDPVGGVILAGGAFGPDFPVTAGAFQTNYKGGSDGYISRLDPTGSTFTWSTFLGGAAGGEGVTALASTPSGELIAAGRTGSKDFPTTPGAYSTSKAWSASGVLFVSRLSADVSQLLASTFVGGSFGFEDDYVKGVALDVSGAITIAGSTNTASFPTTPGSFQPAYTPGAPGQGFVTRLDANVTQLLFSTFIGGTSAGISGLAVDPSGIVTIGGGTADQFPTTPGAFDTNPEIGPDFFVARLSPSADRLFYSTALGGPSSENSTGMAMTDTGRVTQVGYSYCCGGYPTTPNAFQPDYVGGQTDGVITTFDLLLQGVEHHGGSTPSCLGPLVMNVTEMPADGASGFGFFCGNAPPLANGWLVVGKPARVRLAVLGVGIWVALGKPFVRIPVQANAQGYVETAFPISAGSQGVELGVQYVFANTPSCGLAGTWSASNGLAIIVQ